MFISLENLNNYGYSLYVSKSIRYLLLKLEINFLMDSIKFKSYFDGIIYDPIKFECK